MYINKLNIFGFKSFADKVAVDFDSGITAIVGPNGCGKTNIVDAVRWVIGEQKASVLRSSTMENVIFSGTKNRKPLSIAEVSLTIENTKGILPSEYTEITITRRCYRDGTSNYLLNGVPCRLKDITSLFMDTGMGSDAYSVIELKMVNEILSHRTQDRRKLFEEAAGITKYKERRREALYRLEQAKESLMEANFEIKNRQRSVNAYEKIAQKQQEAREISDKLKVIEVDYHKRYMSKLIDEIKSVEEELKYKDTEREEVQVSLNEAENRVDEVKKIMLGVEKKLNDTRDKLTDININVNDTQNSITMAEQRITYLKENIQRYSSEKSDIERQIENLYHKAEESDEKLGVLNNTIVLLDESSSNKRESLNLIEDKVRLSKEYLKKLSTDLSSLQQELLERHNEYKNIKNKLDEQYNKNTKLTDENIKSINFVKSCEENINTISNLIDNTKSLLMDVTYEYSNKRKEKENTAEEINRIEKEIIHNTYNADKIKEKINFQVNLLESFEDYAEGVKYLVRDKKDKDAVTIIDNIIVEDKFRIAIETALGEISNYLIVNNSEKLERLINILEENNKGKVTFIIRDNLYNTTMNIFQDEFPEILNSMGVYGWADKFIKCPDEYFLLYKYLLDEYIIVENVETAKRLSKDNFIKFITLDGDIITNSFIRSGSKTNIESVKIGREKLIAELENQVSELENVILDQKVHLNEVKTRHDSFDLRSVEAKLDSIKNDLNEKENELSRVVYQRDQSNNTIDNNTSEINRLTESNKELSIKMDELIKELEVKENMKYKQEKETDAFTTALENLTTEMTNKREELNSFNIEVTEVRGEQNNIQNELIRTNSSISTRKRTIEARSKEIIECENEINTLNDKVGTQLSENTFTGLTALLKQFNITKSEVESDLNFIRNEYDIKRKEFDDLEENIKILRTTRDGLINYIHKGDMQLTKDRLEIKEHREKILEDYSIEINYEKFEDAGEYDYIGTKSEIDKMKMRLKQLGGTGQMELNLYEEEKRALLKLLEEKDDLIKAQDDLTNLIEQINTTAQNKFRETFDKIRENFKNIFRELFMEGDEADLKLVIDEDNTDPLEAKIDIIAKPRGKRPQLIDLLSGGEKTLTAIALLFAIYQVKPSPFCILDEVDAPLDDANIDRFVKIIRKFSKETQFIIVTHNKRTMEAADSMYGVTMAEEGISTIVNVQFNDKIAV